MKNLKLFLIALACWFIGSILIIKFIVDTVIMSICFVTLSIGLVFIIYRVLYLEFFYKYSKKYRNSQKEENTPNSDK